MSWIDRLLSLSGMLAKNAGKCSDGAHSSHPENKGPLQQLCGTLGNYRFDLDALLFETTVDAREARAHLGTQLRHLCSQGIAVPHTVTYADSPDSPDRRGPDRFIAAGPQRAIHMDRALSE